MLRSAVLVIALGYQLWPVLAMAQQTLSDSPRYIADIELETSSELVDLLQRANQLLVDGVAAQDGSASVTFVLHGPVIKDLLRQNYAANRQLVDLAASLSALRVVKIEVCRTWMGVNDVSETDLQPFVEPVDLASSEVRRLRERQNYLDF
ncbi:MAG: hypothetical protein H6985_05460 [Pseudomonadales bacterium]|nr:hypothetical protein [Halioglobus sp.]MCP5129018.1 hypothetical protein [Pseudomonadales bacterium]